MATKPKAVMTVEEFLKKYEGSPAGRYELEDGAVVTMAAETAGHVRTKWRAQASFSDAVKKIGLPCEVFGDGMTIKIDRHTAREPDVSMQCNRPVDDNSILLDNPLIVIEVISPSSVYRDTSRKLADYFSVASIQHYLIVDPAAKLAFHHQRSGGGKILTTIIRSGAIEFVPPGFSVSLESILGNS
jgi:Uma2 family endonuclease